MKKAVLIIAMAALAFPGAALAGQQSLDDTVASSTHLASVSSGEATAINVSPDPFNGQQKDCSSDGCADSSRITAKFSYFAQHSLESGALVSALFTAGPEMAKPPAHYPREWRDGALAFGRLYGDAFAFQTAGQSGRFVAAVALHENLSYSPSSSRNPLARAMHAIVFTAFDKSDSGHTIPAFSNFAGAASAGFVGTAYLPRGYNDPSHVLNRSTIAFATFAVTNLASEFSPQLRSLGRRLRLPQFLLGTPK